MITIMSDKLVADLLKLSNGAKKLASKEFLFRVNDPVRSLFLVTQGTVQLTRTLRRGFQLNMQSARSGEIVAEASLFSDRYHCDGRACEASTISIIPMKRLMTAINSDSELAITLMSYLAHEVQRARARAETLSLKTVAERVDAWMTLNQGLLPRKGHWHEVATEIGISAEALYRELAHRRQRGGIKTSM